MQTECVYVRAYSRQESCTMGKQFIPEALDKLNTNELTLKTVKSRIFLNENKQKKYE